MTKTKDWRTSAAEWGVALALLAIKMGAFTLLSFPGVAGFVAGWLGKGILVAALIYGILNYRGN